MLRADLLIEEAREGTENTESTSETGVQDSEYLRALNDAQDKIHSGILLQNPDILEKEKEIDGVAEQEAYDLPADVFGTSRIIKVEYSLTGLARDYYPLELSTERERLNGLSGQPSYYIRQSQQLLIQPKPAGTGKFRLLYEKVIPRLDKRRGRVSAVTLNTTDRTITTLTIDPTTFTTEDVEIMNKYEYLCIVSKTGTIKMKGIPITEVNSSTGDVTVETFTYEAGETITVGDYVVAGKYATTHSELPDITERFLLTFTKWRILKRDSSNDSMEESQELKDMYDDIMATYGRADKGIKRVPIIDDEYF